jgi:hypothetical protein
VVKRGLDAGLAGREVHTSGDTVIRGTVDGDVLALRGTLFFPDGESWQGGQGITPVPGGRVRS